MRKICFALFLLLLSAAGYAGEYELSIQPLFPQPGRCFEVRFNSAAVQPKMKVEFLGRKIAGYGGRAIIGIPPEQKPGIYLIKLMVEEENGKISRIEKKVTVKSHRFPIVSFWLKLAKKKLLAKDLVEDEWGRIEKILLREAPEQQWNGLFLVPVSGEVSMLFGTRELVNRIPRSQHRGLDLAVPIGTRVRAANNGRVVFTEKLKAFGGTVVIDHGQGVFSLYFHLSKFLIVVGQTVAKGQVVALSGNTGASSGPHLHWGMSVHDLRVDPQQWVESEL